METDLLDAASELLPLVTETNQRLALSPELPPDIHAVVEKVYTSLPAPLDEAAGGIDPFLTEALSYGTARCYRALTLDKDSEKRAELRIGLEQVRQALAYLLDEEPVADDRPPQQVAAWLVEATDVPQTDLARVLDVAPKTLHRWVIGDSTPGADEVARLRVVARIVANLRHAYTGPGAVAWFEHQHPDLKRRPADLLSQSSNYPSLLKLAARTRSQDAA